MTEGPSLPGVAAVLEAGRADRIAPALAAVVLRRGALVHQGAHGTLPGPVARRVTEGDLFDVASLTKVLATTTLAAQAVAEGALELDAPALRWLPGFDAAGKAGVTVRHLLAHSSGLAAWRPWHQAVARDPEAAPLFAPSASRPPAAALAQAAVRARALVRAALLAEPLEAPPGTRAVYSDPGFVALGWIVEAALGAPLDSLFAARVAGPLGLAATGFAALSTPAWMVGRGVAPTRFSPARQEALQGTVDDDNAWALGGVAGHAGLFSTAAEVAIIGQAWLDALEGRAAVVPAAVAPAFARRDATVGSTRALGWDTRSPEGSTLGDRLGRGRRGALGHLAFTGCSLWLDLDEGLVAVLLTNHVHPAGPDKSRLLDLRRRFHDAVAEGLGIGAGG